MTASYDLCRQIYERFHWEETHYFWHSNKRYDGGNMQPTYDLEFVEMYLGDGDIAMPNYDFDIPAYDLDYLLGKLPSAIDLVDDSYDFQMTRTVDDKWQVDYRNINDGQFCAEIGDTPIEAVAKLILALPEEVFENT